MPTLSHCGHPAFSVDDLQTSLDRTCRIWIVHPDGNRIEMMEMAKTCIQYEAIRDLNAGKAPHALVRPGKAPCSVAAIAAAPFRMK